MLLVDFAPPDKRKEPRSSFCRSLVADGFKVRDPRAGIGREATRDALASLSLLLVLAGFAGLSRS